MTPKEIAQRVVDRATTNAKHPSLFKDEIAKEVARVISEERELLSTYLTFLNETIAREPTLVRHRLVRGSTKIATGLFLEDMTSEEERQYRIRLNPLRRRYATG
jgi:hypothetical protein